MVSCSGTMMFAIHLLDDPNMDEFIDLDSDSVCQYSDFHKWDVPQLWCSPESPRSHKLADFYSSFFVVVRVHSFRRT